MSSSEIVLLSSKGQVVLPKEIRDKLALKKGDVLKIKVDEESKTILLQKSIDPPKEIFANAGTKFSSSLLKESDLIDERKAKSLLKAIGVN